VKPTLSLQGVAQLDKVLQEMAKTTAKRTARKAMSQALDPVLQAARDLAPVGPTGRLRDGVNVSHKLNKSQAGEAPREGKDVLHMYVGSNSPHAHLVEFGTGPRHHKSGKYVGSMPPNPWMRPAWDGNRQAVLDGLAAALRAEIEKTLARIAKRKANAARKAARG
jgi:HK97 gp10 family phage protein